MIVFKGKDGSVAIMHLVDGADEDGAVKKFLACHEGQYEDTYLTDLSIPEDYTYRDAWTLQEYKIVVDKKKAMQIHLDRLRIIRNKKLEELDRDQLRYLSDSVKLAEIEAKKQVLRDLPARKDLKLGDVPPELI
jgi:hypothetical protein